MALINCSECGNIISDKATFCPNCGYPMATTKSTNVNSQSMNNVTYEETNKPNWASISTGEISNQKLRELEELQIEMNNKLDEVDKSSPPTKYPYRKLASSLFWSVAFIALPIVLFLLRDFFAMWVYDNLFIYLIYVFILIFAVLMGIIGFLICLFAIPSMHKQDKLKLNNFAEWQKQETKRIKTDYNQYAENIVKYGQREKPINTKICPNCGSTNVKKINHYMRGVTAGLWLLSGKNKLFDGVGKTYHCNKCNRDF